MAELRKRVSKMRLHADKGQGTPRGRPISASGEAEANQGEAHRGQDRGQDRGQEWGQDRGQDESVRAALERTLQQLQLKDRRCTHLEAEADRVAEAKTKVSTQSVVSSE